VRGRALGEKESHTTLLHLGDLGAQEGRVVGLADAVDVLLGLRIPGEAQAGARLLRQQLGLLEVLLVERVEPQALAQRVHAAFGETGQLGQFVARQQESAGRFTPAVVAL
jgi:hypothetical protein